MVASLVWVVASLVANIALLALVMGILFLFNEFYWLWRRRDFPHDLEIRIYHQSGTYQYVNNRQAVSIDECRIGAYPSRLTKEDTMHLTMLFDRQLKAEKTYYALGSQGKWCPVEILKDARIAKDEADTAVREFYQTNREKFVDKR